MRSAPYRAFRSLGALTGGLLREASLLALPVRVREAALYRATAGVSLRFLIEQPGDVYGVYPRQDPLARKFVHRYAAGTSVELISVATLYLSPVWVLAALGDATRAGKTLFSEIAHALKAEKLLDSDAQFETMQQLLENLQDASGKLGRSVFSVSAAMGISALSSVPAQLQWLSRSALVAARTTGMVVGDTFLKHYAEAGKELAKIGFANTALSIPDHIS